MNNFSIAMVTLCLALTAYGRIDKIDSKEQERREHEINLRL